MGLENPQAPPATALLVAGDCTAGKLHELYFLPYWGAKIQCSALELVWPLLSNEYSLGRSLPIPISLHLFG